MLFNRRPRVFFDPDDVVAATPVVEPPAPVVTPPADTPWASDLVTYFGDNAEAIAAADRYQREKIQPYITQLESGTAEARELWTDLNADPATTMRDLFTSVYSADPEAGAKYDAMLATAAEPTVEPVVTPTTDEIPEWAKPLVEDRQAKIDREESDAQAKAYTAFKDGLKTSHGLTDDDIGLIDPFIFQSPDNPDVAVAAYKAWQQKAGVTPMVEPVPTPPPVLGDGATTAATPPLATQYKTYDQLGDAIKGFVSRQAASATPPPVVG